MSIYRHGEKKYKKQNNGLLPAIPAPTMEMYVPNDSNWSVIENSRAVTSTWNVPPYVVLPNGQVAYVDANGNLTTAATDEANNLGAVANFPPPPRVRGRSRRNRNDINDDDMPPPF